MTKNLADLVYESANNPGTGTISLGGAPAGRLAFAQGFATGAKVYYVLTDGAQTEWGVGTFTAGAPNTLSRDTVIGNSAGTTTQLSFAGAVQVYNDLPAAKTIAADEGNVTHTPGTLLANSTTATPRGAIEAYHSAALADTIVATVPGGVSGSPSIALVGSGTVNMFVGSDSTTYWTDYTKTSSRMYLTSSGALYNATGTYGNFSQRDLKENIGPARSYLDSLCKLDVIKFSYIADKQPKANRLGLIAEDVQSVMPGLVESIMTPPTLKKNADGTLEHADGVPVLAVKSSVLTYMLVQAVQELAARLDKLDPPPSPQGPAT